MRQPTTPLICALLILGLLVSCAPASTRVAPTDIVPLPGKAVITGEISGRPRRWANEALVIYAAPYSGDANQAGVYFLEPALHPHAPLDGDAFQLDAAPGDYVLVVGPSAEEALLLVDDQSQPLRIKVKTAQVIELGRVALSLP
ncbi:MAG TPA: hypothetical protein VLH85_01630 [Levilinea sp.]|nr:hypothetical protein [Levilinea sp.]